MTWKKKKDTPEAQTPEAAAAGKGPVPFLKKNWKWRWPPAPWSGRLRSSP